MTNENSNPKRQDNSGASARVSIYVLVFEGDHFYVSQNLYLGRAQLTQDIEAAAHMTLDEAEEKWSRMTEKDNWEIWSVRTGIVLNEKSERHIIREKRKELERQLRALEST